MDLKIIEIMKYARKPIVENTKPGDNVLIVADTTTDPVIWQALSAACHEHGAIPTVTIMTTRKGDGHDPTIPVAEAMRVSDMAIFVTYRSLIHARLVHQIQDELDAAGKPQFEWVLMEQITPEMLLGGAVEEDSDWMFAVGDRIQAAWANAKTIHVTSEFGTDLRASIKGSFREVIAGRIRRTPERPRGGMAFPDGESNIFPIEGTGEGIIVWDVSAHHVGMLSQPIKLTVTKGKVVKIEGGSQSRDLERLLAEQNDPNCYCAPAEIALGLNRKVVPKGLMRSDKKLYGGIHVAIGGDGTSKTGVGRVKANLHLDGIMRAPKVVVDDKVILCEGGKIVI